MGNDLRERPKDTYSLVWNAVWNGAGLDDGECESITQSVLTALGDFVTRSEMEEAVAKAVAEEREAMAHETSRLLGEWIRRGKLTEKLPDAPYIVADYRARSEQKEGE